MAITVNFPAALFPLTGQSVIVRESVSTLGQLITALDRLSPGIAHELVEIFCRLRHTAGKIFASTLQSALRLG